MVRVLADNHMSDQRFGRHPAIDRAARCRGLHDGALAGPTAVAGPAGVDHPELGRDDVELLADILTDAVHRSTPPRAIRALRPAFDLLARHIPLHISTVAPPSLLPRRTLLV